MSRLINSACVALAAYLTPLISGSVPAMSGAVLVDKSSFADPIFQPAVVIIPGRFHLEPYQEMQEDDSIPDRLLVSVGEMVGTVEVQSWGNTPYIRRHLEEAVTEAMNTELAPGVVTLTMNPVSVGGTAWTTGSLCSFEMDDAQWDDEMAFASRRYSHIKLTARVPNLYCRMGVYGIDSYLVQVSAAASEDLSTSAFVSGSDAPFEAVDLALSGSLP